jgi:hypothetical protein
LGIWGVRSCFLQICPLSKTCRRQSQPAANEESTKTPAKSHRNPCEAEAIMRRALFVVALMWTLSCGSERTPSTSPTSPTPTPPPQTWTLSGTTSETAPYSIDRRCRRDGNNRRRAERRPVCDQRCERCLSTRQAAAWQLHDSHPGRGLRRRFTADHTHRRSDGRHRTRPGVSDSDDDQE